MNSIFIDKSGTGKSQGKPITSLDILKQNRKLYGEVLWHIISNACPTTATENGIPVTKCIPNKLVPFIPEARAVSLSMISVINHRLFDAGFAWGVFRSLPYLETKNITPSAQSVCIDFAKEYRDKLDDYVTLPVYCECLNAIALLNKTVQKKNFSSSPPTDFASLAAALHSLLIAPETSRRLVVLWSGSVCVSNIPQVEIICKEKKMEIFHSLKENLLLPSRNVRYATLSLLEKLFEGNEAKVH
jgi:hypothetical protein